MYSITKFNITLEITKGNIVNQSDLDAVVNAANAELRPGGGVAGAIHKAAGPELDKACRPLAPIQPGEAVVTESFKLENDYIVHTLGPVYGRDKPEDRLLAASINNCLILAEENKLESIGFPAISTGAFGYPLAEAAEVILQTIQSTMIKLNKIKKIRLVLVDQTDFDVFKNKAEEIFA
ncbi:MAG: macro domain-containing protein [Bacillota bacterium]